MSDPKDFLARWSQRKLKPDAEKPAPADASQPSGSDKNPGAPSGSVPEFDITTLPSLESIGANSDIRAFLQRGVPASLTRAALRRAWSADPAIRDFIGLSENSWDFNAPDALRGFGPLSEDEVRLAMERFFGTQTEETIGQGAPEDVPEEQVSLTDMKPASRLDNQPPSPVVPGPQILPDVAAQHEEDEKPAEPSLKVRRHGGALPE